MVRRETSAAVPARRARRSCATRPAPTREARRRSMRDVRAACCFGMWWCEYCAGKRKKKQKTAARHSAGRGRGRGGGGGGGGAAAIIAARSSSGDTLPCACVPTQPSSLKQIKNSDGTIGHLQRGAFHPPSARTCSVDGVCPPGVAWRAACVDSWASCMPKRQRRPRGW